MNDKIYCFDFDGTIADTLPLIVEKINFLLKRSGEEEISDYLLRKIRNEGIEDVFKEMEIPIYKLLFLYIKIKKEINADVSGITVNKNIKEVLITLKERDCRLGILTSNSKSNVEKFLKSNNIDFFDFIYTSGIFGKEKIIKKIKRRGGIFLYIGDETRDIKAGRKAKVKTVAVPWGLSSKKALLRARPDILIEKPHDLLTLSF